MPAIRCHAGCHADCVTADQRPRCNEDERATGWDGARDPVKGARWAPLKDPGDLTADIVEFARLSGRACCGSA